MGRLKTMQPRLKSVGSRIGQVGGVPASRDVRRSKAKPWRKWYATKRWRDMRIDRLRLMNWTCEQTGELLIGQGNDWNAPVLDHIEPHNGDPVLFWDLGNVQIVTKQWHDSEKQKQERAGLA